MSSIVVKEENVKLDLTEGKLTSTECGFKLVHTFNNSPLFGSQTGEIAINTDDKKLQELLQSIPRNIYRADIYFKVFENRPVCIMRIDLRDIDNNE